MLHDTATYVLGDNMRKFKALDCCCCGGGMSVGLARAGFEVTGVDIIHWAGYPFPMYMMDFRRLTYEHLDGFDYIHLSPPCQQYSRGSALARSRGKAYPDLFGAARRLVAAAGKPYTIENVPGSPAKGIRLYGDMFGLPVLRERIFESNLTLRCDLPRGGTKGEIITVAGSHRDTRWYAAMGIDWNISLDAVVEAVPPAYGEYIGRQVIEILGAAGL